MCLYFVYAVRLIVATRSMNTAAHNWSHLLRRNHHNSCIYGNLQHLCKSTGRWGTLSWIFPAGRSDIPHFIRQHRRDSVLYRRPRHFEGTLTTALARSDAAWLFLMAISERESLPKQTANHSKHHRRNSGSDSGRAGKDFPNLARRVQSCLDANGGHF